VAYREIGGKIGLKADYDMWGKEYDRLDEILRALTEAFIGVRENPGSLMRLFDIINEFYVILRPLLLAADRPKKDAELAELKAEVVNEINRRASFAEFPGNSYVISEELLVKLNAYRNSLMDTRQVLGMGVRGSAQKSNTARLKKAVGRV